MESLGSYFELSIRPITFCPTVQLLTSPQFGCSFISGPTLSRFRACIFLSDIKVVLCLMTQRSSTKHCTRRASRLGGRARDSVYASTRLSDSLTHYPHSLDPFDPCAIYQAVCCKIWAAKSSPLPDKFLAVLCRTDTGCVLLKAVFHHLL